MMTTRQGNYMIYKMFDAEGESHTEFFLPDDSVRRKLERLLTLQTLKDQGYDVLAIAYVNKETYLNARLNETVEEYLYMDKSELETKYKFKHGHMEEDVALSTLEMIQEYKWTLLKKIHRQIRRIVREDFDVQNEIALALNDLYLKQIL